MSAQAAFARAHGEPGAAGVETPTLLQLRGPALQALRDDPTFVASWQVVGCSVRDAVNTLFDASLCVAHPELPHDLRPALGRELRLRVDTGCGPQPTERWWCGLVTRIESLGAPDHADGGVAHDPQASLTLRPWPVLARLRTASRVWQQRSVVDVLGDVLGEYGYAWELRLHRSYARLDHLVQFDESDWDFLQRLCARWGLHHHVEHGADGHRLVLGDTEQAFREQPVARCRSLEVRPWQGAAQAGALEQCAEQAGLSVQAWQSRTQQECHPWRWSEWRAGVAQDDSQQGASEATSASSASTASPASPAPPASARGASITRWGGVDGVSRPRRAIDWEDGTPHAAPRSGAVPTEATGEPEMHRVRLRQARRGASTLRARGCLPGLAAAHTLRLRSGVADASEQAPTHLVVGLRMRCRSRGGAPRLQVVFDLVALDGAVCAVPPRTSHARPAGVQTATVLDAPAPTPGQRVFTDGLGRLRVRMHWAAARASADPDASTCWIGMARTAAGERLGSAAWPRPGQEVLVDFLDGDPDCPVCLGTLRHPAHRPPWPLPLTAQVGGWRSRELDADDGVQPAGGEPKGGGANHLLLDDTADALQAELYSSSHDSALRLGRHAPVRPDSGRGADRAEGFELRTQAFGAVRAGRALLLLGAASGAAAASILQPMRSAFALFADGLRRRAAQRPAHDALQALPGASPDALRPAVTSAGPDARGAPLPCEGTLALQAEGAIGAATAQSGVTTAAARLAASAAGHASMVARAGARVVADGAAVFGAAGHGVEVLALRGTLRVCASRGELHMLGRDDVQLSTQHGVARLRCAGVFRVQAPGQQLEFGGGDALHASAGRWAVRAASRDCVAHGATPAAGSSA